MVFVGSEGFESDKGLIPLHSTHKRSVQIPSYCKIYLSNPINWDTHAKERVGFLYSKGKEYLLALPNVPLLCVLEKGAPRSGHFVGDE